MNKNYLRLLTAVFSIVSLAAFGYGQTEDRDDANAASGSLYVVSAKAGATSYVEGPVTVGRESGTAGQLLVGDFIEVGETVSTGKMGRAEILMNPGSYLRIDNSSSFEFGSTALEDLKIKILKGSAIFEVYASDDFKVNVTAGDSEFYLIKTGVYRIDVDAAGKARLEVRSGKAVAGDDEETTIKKGRFAVARGETVAVAKFDKSKDEFENWSEDRAELLAKENARLIAGTLSRRVTSSFLNYGWNCYDSIGLWVFNRQLRSFSFLPFGYGWKSAYGHRLRNNALTCNYPEEYWRQPYYDRDRRPPVNPGGGNGGPTTTVVPQANIDRSNRITTPPFQRMEQSGSVSRSGSSSFPSDSGSTTYSPPFNTGNSGSSNSSKSMTPSAPAPQADRAPSSPSQKTVKVDN